MENLCRSRNHQKCFKLFIICVADLHFTVFTLRVEITELEIFEILAIFYYTLVQLSGQPVTENICRSRGRAREFNEATEGDASTSERVVTGFPVHFIPWWHAWRLPGSDPPPACTTRQKDDAG